MSKSLKTIANEKRGGASAPSVEDAGAKLNDVQGVNDDMCADMNTLLGKYGNKSESELMNELKTVTSQQKRDGTYDGAAMREAMQRIMPMLNDEQKKKLQSITNQLGL